MKRISSKILSMLLACTMLLCLAPVAMASTSVAMPADYGYVIWSENFNGDTALDTTNTFTNSNFVNSLVNDKVELTYDPDASTVNYPSNFLFVMKSGTSTAPVQSSGKTVSELSKMQVSFDVIASTSNQLSIAFRDQFSETAAAQSYGVTSYIATMKTDGTIAFMGSSSSYTYQTGDLLSFDVFFDFTGTSGKYSLYINNQMVVENANIVNDSMKCVEALRFETSVKEKKETFTYGVDNIRFAIPEPCGYEYVITEHNFDDLAAGTVITSGDTTYTITSNTSTNDTTVEIVKDEKGEHGNVLKIKSNNAGRGVGILKKANWNYPASAPLLIKLEMDLKRESDSAFYIFATTPSGDTSKSLIQYSFNSKVLNFNNGNGVGKSNSGVNVEKNKWMKLEMYFNYATGKYSAYIDGSYINEYNIDTTNVKNLESIYVSGNTTVYIDNFKISTIPACALPVISEYKTHGTGATTKLGFLAKNSETSEKTYKILLAKFNSNDTLANVTISDGSVAASTSEFEELTYPTLASDGSYYKYFVFDSMSNIVPLVESITIE